MMRLTNTWRAAALTMLLASCTQAAASPTDAVTDCASHSGEVAKRWGAVRTVSGAFAVQALDVIAWQETRDAAKGIRPTSPLRRLNLPVTTPLLVCYYDGDFDHFPGKGHRPPYDRIVVIIDGEGRYTIDSAGPSQYLHIEKPGAR